MEAQTYPKGSIRCHQRARLKYTTDLRADSRKSVCMARLDVRLKNGPGDPNLAIELYPKATYNAPPLEAAEQATHVQKSCSKCNLEISVQRGFGYRSLRGEFCQISGV